MEKAVTAHSSKTIQMGLESDWASKVMLVFEAVMYYYLKQGRSYGKMPILSRMAVGGSEV
jgi:hypothetical protein